jgi:hypothetical protein
MRNGKTILACAIVGIASVAVTEIVVNSTPPAATASTITVIYRDNPPTASRAAEIADVNAWAASHVDSIPAADESADKVADAADKMVDAANANKEAVEGLGDSADTISDAANKMTQAADTMTYAADVSADAANENADATLGPVYVRTYYSYGNPIDVYAWRSGGEFEVPR